MLGVKEAGRIYWYSEERKGSEDFVSEVSVDESRRAARPCGAGMILAMIAEERIPVRTIAPKFTDRFNKGVDYVGDLAKFERQFDEDLSVILRHPRIRAG